MYEHSFFFHVNVCIILLCTLVRRKVHINPTVPDDRFTTVISTVEYIIKTQQLATYDAVIYNCYN